MVTGKSHKPSHFVRLVIYPLVGLFFFLVLGVVLILANGYRFTFEGHKIGLTKTGMLILSTRPFDATITLNGKLSSQRTGFYLLPTKISSLKPGNYDVTIAKKGYRTWRNRLEINPNLVTWANYILLFPEKLNITKIDVPVGNLIARSTNGRHLLFAGTDNGKFSLKSLDSNNLSVKDFWPTIAPTEPWLVSPQIKSAEFSPNSDRVLLLVTNGSKTEFVVADASGSQAKLLLLGSNLKTDISEAWWNTSNNNEMYLATAAGVSLANINDNTLTASILANYITFKVDESRQIFYIAKNMTGTYSVNRMNLDGGNKAVLVESVLPAKSYKLGFSPQNNVLAVLNNDTGNLTAYYIGSSTKKYSLDLSGGVAGYSWSKNGQKLLYWGKNFAKRYDFEKNKEVDVLLADAPISLGWYFDEYHYLVQNTNGTYVMDTDGAYVVPIIEGKNTQATLDLGSSNMILSAPDANGKVIYSKFIAEF